MNPTLLRAVRWTLVALTLISLAAAVETGWQRIQWEARYTQVSLALTGPSALRLLDAGPASAFGLVQHVVFDAASLEAFAPFHFAPLATFEALPAPVSNAELAPLRARGLGVVVALPPLPVLDEPRLALLARAFEELNVAGALLVETASRWPAQSLARVVGLLEARGAWAGALEFFEPEGLLPLYRQGHTHWVRAHLIPERERAGVGQAEALARYERAVRERSLRLLLVNDTPNGPPLTATLEALSDRLSRAGYALGGVPELPPWQTPPWSVWALSLSLWALTVWVFQRVWATRPWALALLGAAAAAVVVWQGFRADEGLRVLSLSMAILTPMCLYRGLQTLPERRGLGYGLIVLGLGTAATTLGGLVQAALLSDPAYFLKLAEASGVKLALIEPVLVIAYWEIKRRGRVRWAGLWRRPLTWGDVVLGGAAVGALILLMLRSGNDAPLPALPFEEAVRGQLEAWLYARPRFKEFLVGHPLLLLWAGWGVRRWGGLGVGVVVFAFLGQTTIHNSFAHLHTPLTLTLLRVVNGLLLGSALGTALWAVVRWAEARWRGASS